MGGPPRSKRAQGEPQPAEAESLEGLPEEQRQGPGRKGPELDGGTQTVQPPSHPSHSVAIPHQGELPATQRGPVLGVGQSQEGKRPPDDERAPSAPEI